MAYNDSSVSSAPSACLAHGGEDLVVLCLEVSESLVEPMCSTAELQQELVPYVLSQSLQSSAFLKLSKEERKTRVKALTQKMLSGEFGGGGEGGESQDDEGDVGPARFWAHLRNKYGTRRGHLLEMLKHLEPWLSTRTVVVLRFEGEVGEPSASLLVRASAPCSVDARQASSAARLEFAPGSFTSAELGSWLQDLSGGSNVRAPPLWPRLADECQQKAMRDPGGQALVLLLCTEMRATDTVPNALAMAGHVLQRVCEKLPCLSGLSLGPQSSERLAALEELSAWTGGISFNVSEPTMVRSAVDCLAAHLFANAGSSRTKVIDERRDFYLMKQKLGTCFLALPSLESRSKEALTTLGSPSSAVSPVTPAGRRPVSLLDLLGDGVAAGNLDGSLPSGNVLAVLSETSLALPRRWSRGLRCWRERRGLRDVVFSEPGGLGLELDEPELDQSDPILRVWRLRATHPPASALKMEENSVLLAINQARVQSETPRSEVSRRAALRPVSFTFRSPGGGRGETDAALPFGGPMLMSVVSEIAVAELREGFPPILQKQPPLSTAIQRVAEAKKQLEKQSAQCAQVERLLQKVAVWGKVHDGATPEWIKQALGSAWGDAKGQRFKSAALDNPFSREPLLLYHVQTFCSDPVVLARSGQACSAWQWLLLQDARRGLGLDAARSVQYQLWKWVVRWGTGPPPAKRFQFWHWVLNCSKTGSTTACFDNGSPSSTLLSVALRADSADLLRLAGGLGGASPGVEIAVTVASHLASTVATAADGGRHSSPIGAFSSNSAFPPTEVIEVLLREPFHTQRLWMLSHRSLSWLTQQGRLVQVMLAAHCPNLFKHLVTEGVAPELFYLWWLQSLFQGLGGAVDCVRLWDDFIMQGSYKVFIRTTIAIFGLLELRLMRCDVDGMMKILFDSPGWGLDPDDVRGKALQIKVTRAMLREVERVDCQASAQ